MASSNVSVSVAGTLCTGLFKRKTGSPKQLLGSSVSPTSTRVEKLSAKFGEVAGNGNSFQQGLATRPPVAQKRMCSVRAVGSTLLEMQPKVELKELNYDISFFGPRKSKPVDPVVVGGGPAGLAVAQRVSGQGLSVCCIDPEPRSVWPNNYGVWVEKFGAMDLLDCLDYTWGSAVVYLNDERKKSLQRPYGRVNRMRLKSKMIEQCITNGVQSYQSKVKNVKHSKDRSFVVCDDGYVIETAVVLDATGHSRRLVQYDKPFNPGYQIAYRIVAEVDCHPFDLDKMLFMEWRDSHLRKYPELQESDKTLPTLLYAMPFSWTKIYPEETSLVASPSVPLEVIQQRLEVRLKHLGINVKSTEEDEVCVIPMGGVLPMIPQMVLAIGGTARMVHLPTGYMVARTLAAAPIVAVYTHIYFKTIRRRCGEEERAMELGTLLCRSSVAKLGNVHGRQGGDKKGLVSTNTRKLSQGIIRMNGGSVDEIRCETDERVGFEPLQQRPLLRSNLLRIGLILSCPLLATTAAPAFDAYSSIAVALEGNNGEAISAAVSENWSSSFAFELLHTVGVPLADLDPNTAKLAITVLGPFFAFFNLLFIFRIVMSWYPQIPVSKFPFVLAYAPTEPILGPTRRLIPPVGGVDVAPVIWVAVMSFLNEILLGKQGLFILLSQQQS